MFFLHFSSLSSRSLKLSMGHKYKSHLNTYQRQGDVDKVQLELLPLMLQKKKPVQGRGGHFLCLNTTFAYFLLCSNRNGIGFYFISLIKQGDEQVIKIIKARCLFNFLHEYVVCCHTVIYSIQ